MKDSEKSSKTDEKKQIRQQIIENSKADFPYLFMNVMATIIAGYGLLLDSTAVVIGAMLIAALLGPITGTALGLVDGNRKLLKIALSSEAIGVATVLATAFIIGLVHSEYPTGGEIASRTSPNIMDLIVAVAGGAAGAYATVKPKISAGLIGVAISTALVPPLATCSILLARGQYNLAFGGFLLFFTNFVAIQFASSIVFWFSGYRKLISKSERNIKEVAIQGVLSFGILILLVVVLGWNFLNTVYKQGFEQDVRAELEEAIKKFPTTSISDVQFKAKDNKNIITAVLQTPVVVTKQQVAEVEKKLPKYGKMETELHVRSVITTETTKNGNIDPTNMEDSTKDSKDISKQ